MTAAAAAAAVLLTVTLATVPAAVAAAEAVSSAQALSGPVIQSGDTPEGLQAGNGALQSVDLAGTWAFTPQGRSATTIAVPGGGWYKQGFTDVNEATYQRTVNVPDTGQPQRVLIEFGAVNHEVTLSVDGTVVGTQTTSFTASVFDITDFVTPGSQHVITADVKGRGALTTADNRYLVPDAAEWAEAIPQGIYRSAFLRVYPAVRVSDTHITTSVANKTLSYQVSVTNDLDSPQDVTLAGSVESAGPATFDFPEIPSRTVTVPAKTTQQVTVGPIAWDLGEKSYWWPNVPYSAGYRAQLNTLTVRATVGDQESSTHYRFGFRESTQQGEYYYLNGVRVNYRGDNLQGADFDRIDNGGRGDAYDTLPGFLPPSQGNPGWPQAVDNYQRLNYNVVRIHQEPASPYMLDVADEMGLMIIDETAIRGSSGGQDFILGHDNMVGHARDLALRDRNHAAVIRWSQSNEPGQSATDSVQFEQDLYHAFDDNDGTRPISIDLGTPQNALDPYPGLSHPNLAWLPHYIDGFGNYGEKVIAVPNMPDGEGEFIWPACNTKQGLEWFATAVAAKRGKDASDLRPYTLLSGWASVIPGVKTTDFVPEEGGHPVYGADNLPDPWANSQIQDIQNGFNPVAAIDLPYWSASGRSDAQGSFPVDSAVPVLSHEQDVVRQITVFNDDLRDTAVDFSWTARADGPDGPVLASGRSTVDVPLGSRATVPVAFTTPATGDHVYLQLATAKRGQPTFSDGSQYFNLGNPTTRRDVDDADSSITYTGNWSHASGDPGLFDGTNTYSDATDATASLTFDGTNVVFHGVTAPNHGIVGISVDGGPETLVDEYSATRTGDVALWTSPTLPLGTHTITVRSTGQNSASSSYHWATVDRFEVSTEVPQVPSAVVKLTAPDGASDSGWYRQPVAVDLQVPAGASAQYQVDGGSWLTYRRPFTVSFSGEHTVATRLLKGTDVVAGSENSTPVKIDRRAPSVSLVRNPVGGVATPRNPVTMTVSGADELSGVAAVQYRTNGGDWQDYSSPVVFDAVGQYAVAVRSIDRAGNISSIRSSTAVVLPDTRTVVRVDRWRMDRGGAVTVSAAGFDRFDVLTVKLADRVVGTVQSDVNGSARLSWQVPGDAVVGRTSVSVTGSDGNPSASAVFTVS